METKHFIQLNNNNNKNGKAATIVTYKCTSHSKREKIVPNA